MKNNKILYIVIAIVVIVIIVGGVYWLVKNQNNNTTISSSSTQNNNVAPANSSYEDAVKLYANRRIQLDNNCLVSPSDPTFKIGTVIMLDNRSNKNRNIALDEVIYTLGPYGYKIVTLNTSYSLPHTVKVDCGNGENGGRILLQK